MVRHEAAEALGALSSESSLPLLRKYLDPATEPSREVRETCEIAVGKIEFDLSEEGKARKQKWVPASLGVPKSQVWMERRLILFSLQPGLSDNRPRTILCTPVYPRTPHSTAQHLFAAV